VVVLNTVLSAAALARDVLSAALLARDNRQIIMNLTLFTTARIRKLINLTLPV
jgi:hypothetical protein